MKTAIILAAGQGRKMWPYGLTKNKAYLPVAAKPLIRIMAGQLAQCGIEEIVVVTGYRAGQLAHAVGDLEGVSFAAQAGQAPGTATALLSGWKATSAADVLVLYGDCLIAKEDITRLVAAYEKGGTGAAMLAAKLPDFERPNDWLCTSIADGRVREVKGHSRGGDHRVGEHLPINVGAEKVSQRAVLEATQTGARGQGTAEIGA